MADTLQYLALTYKNADSSAPKTPPLWEDGDGTTVEGAALTLFSDIVTSWHPCMIFIVWDDSYLWVCEVSVTAIDAIRSLMQAAENLDGKDTKTLDAFFTNLMK